MFVLRKLLSFSSKTFFKKRFVQNLSQAADLVSYQCGFEKSGLVMGLFLEETDAEGHDFKFTSSGSKINERTKGKIAAILRNGASPPPKIGQVRMLYGVDKEFPAIAVCGLGGESKGFNAAEVIDEKKEAIRLAVGAGVRAFHGHAVQTIYIDSCSHAESAAEGAALGGWLYQDLRHPSQQYIIPNLKLYDCCDFGSWEIGLEKAAAQNLARKLQESPRNLLTPLYFAQTCFKILSKVGISVEIKIKSWAEQRNFNAFLTVAKGSCEPPIFLEILYEGCDRNICPIILIGKGCTFDTGGLCKNTCEEMEPMGGDLSGAACVVATLKAVSALQLPLNIRGLIPLCENSFGASAFKPGDICAAINDKTILIEDTAAEGVLMLADALNYAKVYNPKFILDVGTITPEMGSGLGSAASGVYSNCDMLFEVMRIASIHTGDRIWRMPLWKYFREYVRETQVSDVTNQKQPRKIGGPSKAASFLHEFLPKNINWIHIDNYGVSRTSGEVYTYLRRGMSGRPTRTLIEFLAQLTCQTE